MMLMTIDEILLGLDKKKLTDGLIHKGGYNGVKNVRI